jgi:MFS family permease
VIIVNAVSYGAAFVALSLLDPERLTPTPVIAPGAGAIREGFRYLRSRPDLVLVLWCVFFLGGFGMNFQITSALMATDEFGKGASEYGVLGSALALGSLAGSLLAARRAGPRLRFIVLSGLGFAVVQVASGLMPTFYSYMAVLPFVGLSILTMATTANAMIQMTSTPAMRGRMAALYVMVFIGSVPLAAPIIGWVAETLGARTALVGAGLFAGLGIAVVTAWYARRTMGEPQHLRREVANLRSVYARRTHLRGESRDRGRVRLPQRLREHRAMGSRDDRDPTAVR